MLETIRTVGHKNAQSIEAQRYDSHEHSYFLLKKYKREMLAEYDDALLQFGEDEKVYQMLNSKLQEAKSVLKSQRATLQKNLDDVILKQDAASWEKGTLEKRLHEQQEQLNDFKNNKYQKEDGENLLRTQNLMQLKERQATAHKKNALESTLSVYSQKQRQLEENIRKIRQENDEERILGKKYTQKLGLIEQDSLQILAKIQNLQDKLEGNTLTIQKMLAKQGDLANYYGQLKKQKKEINIFVKEVVTQLHQEENITRQIMEVESELSKGHYHLQEKLQITQNEISQLKTQNSNEKLQAATNKECLLKLQRYLQTLRNQNQKIETYIQRVMEEDYLIKATIDKKYRSKNYQSTSKFQRNERTPPNRNQFCEVQVQKYTSQKSPNSTIS